MVAQRIDIFKLFAANAATHFRIMQHQMIRQFHFSWEQFVTISAFELAESISWKMQEFDNNWTGTCTVYSLYIRLGLITLGYSLWYNDLWLAKEFLDLKTFPQTVQFQGRGLSCMSRTWTRRFPDSEKVLPQ